MPNQRANNASKVVNEIHAELPLLHKTTFKMKNIPKTILQRKTCLKKKKKIPTIIPTM